MDYNELSAWIQENYPDDYDALLTVAAQLAMYLEGANAIHLVTEEVYAVRQFA